MEKWICSCGHENSGTFCEECGNARPTDQHGNLPPMKPETSMQLDEQDMAIKKWAKSIPMLVFACMASVLAAVALVSAIIKVTQSWLLMVTAALPVLLAAFVCAGAWKTYLAGRKPDMRVDSSGLRMIRGVFVYKQVVTYIVLILILIAVIALFALGMEILQVAETELAEYEEAIDELEQKLAEIFDKANMGSEKITTTISYVLHHLKAILITALILVIAVAVVIFIAFASIRKLMRGAINLLDTRILPMKTSISSAIFLFIYAAISFAPAVLNFSVLESAMGGITNIMSCGLCVVGGILAITYNNTCRKISVAKQQ